MARNLFGGVLVAAGRSSRMGGGPSKTLRPLAGRPVLAYSLEALLRAPELAALAVVVREEDREEIKALLPPTEKPVLLVPGGEERQDSVRLGVEALPPDLDWLLIHDGARPLLTGELISRVCADALEYGAATAAVPCKDTVKLEENGFGVHTPPRERLWLVQTPQAMRRTLYAEAIQQAEREGRRYTDEGGLLEAAGHYMRLTVGDYRNMKITTPEDLRVAEALSREGTV